MNVNDIFPSKYLKASDLNGRTITVRIERCSLEEIGNDQKLVMYFEGKTKGMVANKTNCGTIAAIHGPDTDGWIGKSITLFEQHVPYQGQTVPAIRVMRSRDAAPEPAPAQVTPERQPGEEGDDDLPF